MEIISTIEHVVGTDWHTAMLIIFNLIVIESLLSVDNAAVLATLVMPLPEKDRKRALRIGLILAYIFRGTCLFLASYLIQIKWLKLLGGAYLVYLGLDYFFSHTSTVEDPEGHVGKNRFKFLSPFWSTVLMVETMDLMFSLDNVFAAVAFTDNIILICIGVFIGIIAMRTVAVYFVKLMERHPLLSHSAFVVILLLGLKLMLESIGHYYPNPVSHLLESEHADMYFSIGTVAVFLLPLLYSLVKDNRK